MCKYLDNGICTLAEDYCPLWSYDGKHDLICADGEIVLEEVEE